MRYRVWIQQTNQTYYDVTAKDREEAKDLARKLWWRENYPSVSDVVEIEQQDTETPT